MSVSTTFGFTNVTANQHDVTPTDLLPVANYVPERYNNKYPLQPGESRLNNLTSPLDYGEYLSYITKRLDAVTGGIQENRHPVKGGATPGIQYTVKLDEMVRTQSDDGTFVVDEPIIMYLTCKHPKSGYITPNLIGVVFERLIGALTRSDGTYRFDELMRGGNEPSED